MTDEGIHHVVSDLVPVVVVITMVIAATRVLVLIVGTFKSRAHLRAQTELQNKILDKFGTAKEFTDYLQTETGRKFFENLSKEPASPLTKILGSIQKGAILSFLGIGLLILGQFFLPFDSGNIMLVSGVIALTVGFGFAISSFISYRMAKSWGIIAANHAPAINAPLAQPSNTVAP